MSQSTLTALNLKDDAVVSVLAAVLFGIVGSKFMYDLTSKVGVPGLTSEGPSYTGLLVHAVVFGLLLFAVLAAYGALIKKSEEKQQ